MTIEQAMDLAAKELDRSILAEADKYRNYALAAGRDPAAVEAILNAWLADQRANRAASLASIETKLRIGTVTRH
jgi:hypothetical protein